MGFFIERAMWSVDAVEVLPFIKSGLKNDVACAA